MSVQECNHGLGDECSLCTQLHGNFFRVCRHPFGDVCDACRSNDANRVETGLTPREQVEQLCREASEHIREKHEHIRRADDERARANRLADRCGELEQEKRELLTRIGELTMSLERARKR